MKWLLPLALLVFAAGCLSQEQANPANETGCSDIGCPVDLNATTETKPAEPMCGDGLLEVPEECDVGFPCKSGYCQKCRCDDILANETVSDCDAACVKAGFMNSSIVQDGNCTYNYGKDDSCALRCAYRKVFPLSESGKVCCCRDLKYVKCPKVNGQCECPKESEVQGICAQNKPKEKSG